MNRITKLQFSTSTCLLAILCCVLCLTSCNRLEEGYVVEKWYEPTDTYVAFMPLVISNGNTTTTIIMPYIITDYEDWCVKIKGIDRVHNLTTMLGGFKPQKRVEYIQETQEYVLPMLKQARRNFPDQECVYENLKFIIINQINLYNALDKDFVRPIE